MSDQTASEMPTGLSAGTLLREAREAAGLHIAALAVSLKVPVKKLEALEADRFDLLPDAVFIRALASSVCRTLKVDPAAVLERLPQTSTPRLIHDDNGINAPFRAPSDGAGPSWMDQLSKPVFLAVFALLLGALILIFLPAMQRDEGALTPSKTEMVPPPPAPVMPVEPPVTAETAQPSSPVPVALPPVVAPRSPAAASMPAVAASTPMPSGTATAKPAVASTVKLAGDAVVAAPARPAASAAAVPLPVTGTVVFRAKGESWVEVIDSRGVVTLRKLLGSGETVGASGNLPLTVVVGRVDATEVQVRGKPFDLGAVSRDNVARFEVK